MALTRLKTGELPVGVPLPWPVFGKNGSMLLNAGGIIPMEDAQDLLKAGLYRSKDESAEDVTRHLSQRKITDKPELLGLTTQVESVQIGLLEDGNKERTLFRLEYLGMIPGISLIMSQPQKENRLVQVAVGQSVNVNMFISRFVHAFAAQVLCAQKYPKPHIHLSYPDTVKTSVLRSAKRVSLQFSILALLRMGEDFSIPVSIIELSNHGLALLSEYPLGEPGAEIRMSFSVTTGELSHAIRCNGIIRSGRPLKAQKVYRYGVELLDLVPEQETAIEAFIYHHL